jgi:uracil-DNA glycosylase
MTRFSPYNPAMAMEAQSDPAAAMVRAHALMLAWYREMGADAAVSETSTNWLERGDTRPGADYDIPALAPAEQTAPRPAARAPAATGQQIQQPAPHQPQPRAALQIVPPAAAANRQFPTAAPDEAAVAARAAASAATSIEDLQARLAAFDGCGLKATAKSLCFYRGATPARVMVIGDAPGAEEDKHGQPFVGPAGAMLGKMLAAIGLNDTAVHMTNIVYWRPPGGRPPTAQEAMICRPFIEQQVAFVKPEFLLLLGGAASNTLLGNSDGIARLRGKWKAVEIAGLTLKALPTLHPRDLLRTPLAKRMAWRDVLSLAVALDAKKASQ